MGEEAILLKVAPLAGGEDNVSFHRLKHGRLYIQLKDQTLLDGPALQELDSVESWELKNGQLVITLSNYEKEVKHMAWLRLKKCHFNPRSPRGERPVSVSVSRSSF